MRDQTHSVMLSLPLGIAKISVVAISVVMVVVTLAQVIFRYIFTAPLPWSEELARYCFVWVVFLGASIGLERGVHLGVDIFVNYFPSRFRFSMNIFTTVLIAGFAATVIYASIPVINMNMMQRSPAMGVQMAWIYIAIPVSMALIILVCIDRIIKLISHRTSAERNE